MANFGRRLFQPKFTSTWGVTNADADTYDSDAAAYFRALTTKITVKQKTAYESFIVNCKRVGVWYNRDSIQVYAAPNANAALVDIRNPSRVAVAVNTPTFTAFGGYTGDATTQHINTNCNASLSTIATANNHSLGVLIGTNSNTSFVDAGAEDAASANSTRINPRSGASTIQLRSASSTGFATVGTQATSVGLTALGRANSSTVKVYKDGVLQETGSLTTTAFANLPFFVMANNAAGTATNRSSRQMRAFTFGADMSNDQQLIFNTLINNLIAELAA